MVAMYINGVMTPEAKHILTCRTLANELGKPVVGIYNRSNSAAADFLQTAEDKLGVLGLGAANPATRQMISVIQRYGDPARAKGGLEVYAHSQGSAILSEALRRARAGGASIANVDVTTMGNAAWTMPNGLRSEHHYVFDSDMIPTFLGSSSAVGTLMDGRARGGRIARGLSQGARALTGLLGVHGTAANTYMLHHTGSGARPHGVIGDPVPAGPGQLADAEGNLLDASGHQVLDTEPNYISSLRRFRALEAQQRPLRQAMTPAQAQADAERRSHRALAATVLAGAKTAAGFIHDKAASTYDWLRGRIGGVAHATASAASGAYGFLAGRASTGYDRAAGRISGAYAAGSSAAAAGAGLAERGIGGAYGLLDRVMRSHPGLTEHQIGPLHLGWSNVDRRLRSAGQAASSGVHSVGPFMDRGVRTAGSWLNTGLRSAGGLADSAIRGTGSALLGAATSVGSTADRAVRFAGNVASSAARGLGSLADRYFGALDVFGLGGSPALQRAGTGADPSPDPSALSDQLRARGGSGQPVDAATRARLSPIVGFDASFARIHVGPEAASAASALHAQAFTIGRDVFFGAGRYQPGTQAGQGLLAHELTHVAQQSGMGGDRTQFATAAGGDRMERAAQEAGRRAATAQRSMATQLHAAGAAVAETAGQHADAQHPTAAQHAPAMDVAVAGGITVKRYSRHYQADHDSHITDEDRNRLDSISVRALQLASHRLGRSSSGESRVSGALRVNIDIDLENMSDDEAARVWAEAIVAQVTTVHGTALAAQDREPIRRLQRAEDPAGKPARIRLSDEVKKSIEADAEQIVAEIKRWFPNETSILTVIQRWAQMDQELYQGAVSPHLDHLFSMLAMHTWDKGTALTNWTNALDEVTRWMVGRTGESTFRGLLARSKRHAGHQPAEEPESLTVYVGKREAYAAMTGVKHLGAGLASLGDTVVWGVTLGNVKPKMGETVRKNWDQYIIDPAAQAMGIDPNEKTIGDFTLKNVSDVGGTVVSTLAIGGAMGKLGKVGQVLGVVQAAEQTAGLYDQVRQLREGPPPMAWTDIMKRPDVWAQVVGIVGAAVGAKMSFASAQGAVSATLQKLAIRCNIAQIAMLVWAYNEVDNDPTLKTPEERQNKRAEFLGQIVSTGAMTFDQKYGERFKAWDESRQAATGKQSTPAESPAPGKTTDAKEAAQPAAHGAAEPTAGHPEAHPAGEPPAHTPQAAEGPAAQAPEGHASTKPAAPEGQIAEPHPAAKKPAAPAPAEPASAPQQETAPQSRRGGGARKRAQKYPDTNPKHQRALDEVLASRDWDSVMANHGAESPRAKAIDKARRSILEVVCKEFGGTSTGTKGAASDVDVTFKSEADIKAARAWMEERFGPKWGDKFKTSFNGDTMRAHAYSDPRLRLTPEQRAHIENSLTRNSELEVLSRMKEAAANSREAKRLYKEELKRLGIADEQVAAPRTVQERQALEAMQDAAMDAYEARLRDLDRATKNKGSVPPEQFQQIQAEAARLALEISQRQMEINATYHDRYLTPGGIKGVVSKEVLPKWKVGATSLQEVYQRALMERLELIDMIAKAERELTTPTTRPSRDQVLAHVAGKYEFSKYASRAIEMAKVAGIDIGEGLAMAAREIYKPPTERGVKQSRAEMIERQRRTKGKYLRDGEAAVVAAPDVRMATYATLLESKLNYIVSELVARGARPTQAAPPTGVAYEGQSAPDIIPAVVRDVAPPPTDPKRPSSAQRRNAALAIQRKVDDSAPDDSGHSPEWIAALNARSHPSRRKEGGDSARAIEMQMADLLKGNEPNGGPSKPNLAGWSIKESTISRMADHGEPESGGGAEQEAHANEQAAQVAPAGRGAGGQSGRAVEAQLGQIGAALTAHQSAAEEAELESQSHTSYDITQRAKP